MMNTTRGRMRPPTAPTRRGLHRAAALLTVAGLAVALQVASPAQAADPDVSDPAQQQYRPLVHFTPEENWMNDPNGMVYVDGTYHLFYQHNPQGTRWGNMSWGHATSTDLMTWQEQPLAIPQSFDENGVPTEDIFSGSVVYDENNTSGLAAPGQPGPLVAVYTSAYTADDPRFPGIQAQSVAYSVDKGQTWTKYAHNPVLNRDSQNFRDPKVFRYDGPTGSYWVMAAVEATEHRVLLYRSDDLLDWTYLSDFGPANSVGGIWECPDLFPLPVDGDPGNQKWVMVVNLNPGGVAGGSGGQYFVGDFDGTTFTSESTVTSDALPTGDTFADFENGYGDWTPHNEPGNGKNGPWTDAPATGALPGQSPVTGFVGAGLVNGFTDGDWPVGTLDSPSFTIGQPFVNLLVGGGNHPHLAGTQLANDPPAGRTLFDFELPDGQTLADSGWTLTGDFATDPSRNPSTAGGDYYLGRGRINTWEGGPNGDDNQGEMTSPTFTIDGDDVSFLIGGGKRDDGSLAAELLVDGQVVRTQTGPNAGQLNWRSWDVSDLRGQTAQIRIVDHATGGWGHLTFDHVVIGDTAAAARSEETSVNLVVDGQVVRSATGSNSETLDWASWNVRDLIGKEAHIQVVDNNRFGWGHILLDQVMFSGSPAGTRLEGYDWLDWGRDYYAGVSYSGAPTSGRIMQAWMNNWDYSQDIPTSTWRSSMALPREVTLVSTPKGPRLSQKPVAQVQDQRDLAAAQTRTDVALDGPVDLDGLRASTARVDVVLRPGESGRSGITVFGDDTSGTRIGYDSDTGRVFIDRTASGQTDFSALFPSVDDAPVALNPDGTVTLELYLDRASVELFTADGRVTITDQVFPNAGADAVTAWSEGGTAQLQSITVTPLRATMWKAPDPTPPVITPTVTGTAGANGWYTSDVAANWTVADGESTVTGSEGCLDSAVTSDTPGLTLTCHATSAGGTARSDVVIARDATAPTVSLVGGPDDGAAYSAGTLPAAPTCTASDATSGIAGACAVSGYGTGVGTHTVSAQAVDAAGNAASVSRTYTVQPAAVPHRADLSVTVSGAPSVWLSGTQATLTVTVANRGPRASALTVASLAVGPGLSIVSAPGAKVRLGAQTASWTEAEIASGASRTYRVVVAASRVPGLRLLIGSVVGTVPDPYPSNNIDTQSVWVR
ncbi:hypothetical protein GCM10009806_14960 [Microbacterium flavum]|nr:GH32 C-terminal domain-containing protein [Microbacterium flavum]